MGSSAAYVKRSRAKLKLTQAQLAGKLGLERRSIMRYEQGDELPRLVRIGMDTGFSCSQTKNIDDKTGQNK